MQRGAGMDTRDAAKLAPERAKVIRRAGYVPASGVGLSWTALMMR